jgi:hypothetical protein
LGALAEVNLSYAGDSFYLWPQGYRGD